MTDSWVRGSAHRRVVQPWSACSLSLALSLGLLLTVTFSGCGGDSGGSSKVTISGTAVQGPMVGSTVTAYAVDSQPGQICKCWAPPQLMRSATSGFSIAAITQPVRLEVSGGSFVSETERRHDHTDSGVSVLLPSGATPVSSISINPLTTFVDLLTLGKLPCR